MLYVLSGLMIPGYFFFQAEDGIRDLVRSRGLGDVYKRQDDGRGAARRGVAGAPAFGQRLSRLPARTAQALLHLSLIHI